MAKETYLASSSPYNIGGAFFALCSVLFLLKYQVGWVVYLFAFMCISLAYILWKVPPPKIEIDDLGIRRLQHGDSSAGKILRILQPDIACEWNWVNAVSTTRLNSGTFVTLISVSDDMPSRPKYRMTIES